MRFLFASFLVTVTGITGCMAATELSPNPGLHYYYDVPKEDSPKELNVDVCIYGGTPAGVGAALQARRLGKTVAFAVFRRHVGGLTSAGLTAVDLGKKEAIGGLAAEFLDRMGMWSGFRAADAEKTFRLMLREAGAEVLFEHITFMCIDPY